MLLPPAGSSSWAGMQGGQSLGCLGMLPLFTASLQCQKKTQRRAWQGAGTSGGGGEHPAPQQHLDRPSAASSYPQANISSLSPNLEVWLLGKGTLMRQLIKRRNGLGQEPRRSVTAEFKSRTKPPCPLRCCKILPRRRGRTASSLKAPSKPSQDLQEL